VVFYVNFRVFAFSDLTLVTERKQMKFLMPREGKRAPVL